MVRHIECNNIKQAVTRKTKLMAIYGYLQGDSLFSDNLRFFKSLAAKHKGVKFYFLSIDNKKCLKRLGIRSLPVVMYCKEGMLLLKQYGFFAREIERMISVLEAKEGKNYLKQAKNIYYLLYTEDILSRLYEYISQEAKNGRIKKIFSEMAAHAQRQRSNAVFIADIIGLRSFSSKVPAEFSPQQLSLSGAVEKAIELTNDALEYYKNISKSPLGEVKNNLHLVKEAINNNRRNLRVLKKETDFIKMKAIDELISIKLQKKGLSDPFIF